ncbi:MAG: DNA polymerase I [Melioribacteraceae bacterium]
MQKLVLLDGMALIYKAYFAFIQRPLSNSKGEPASATFGFLNQLYKIIVDTKPDYLAVGFDSKEKTFRHDLYDKYKSSRLAMPEDMIPQIHRIKNLLNAAKIPVLILPGYEADDIIGTVLKKSEENGLISYAVTPDKDYIQLVTEFVNIYKPGKSADENEILSIDKVIADLGFSPINMIDYLALVGDQSDDIPGVPGIGPKTALPLIHKYKTIENLYENIEELEKKSLAEKLILHKESAFLSKQLATIETKVPIDYVFEDMKFSYEFGDEFFKQLNELEFKTLFVKYKELITKNENPNLPNIEPSDIPIEKEIFIKAAVKYHLIKDAKEAKHLAEQLNKSDLIVFDTETDSLDTLKANLIGCSFSVRENEAFFVAVNPFVQKGDLFASDLSDRLELDDFRNIFTPLFSNKNIKKVCQNGKYDIAIMRTLGIEVHNFFFDTMLASYVIDPDEKHGMDDLSEKYLNYKPITFVEVVGKGNKGEGIYSADLNLLSDYACEDADVTFKLYKVLSEKLKTNGMEKIAFDIEFPLVEVLEDMERTGVKIDIPSLNATSELLQKDIDRCTEKIFEISGETFNINSTQQLQTILFDKLNLPKTKKTKTGFSTDARSLESLKGSHEIIDYLMEYRTVAKLKSTYADSLPNLINEKTERIHTTFNQTGASTGRLSSTEPNIQNIPIRTDMGKEIRKAFVAKDENHILLSADYSQIELRIMASICGDPNLTAAFAEKDDIHRRTAALVFNVTENEVDSDMRRKAKEVNFGILYGIGVFGLKTRLGIPQNHAKEIIDTYFKNFSKVKEFMESSKNSAKKLGYAETILGRRRYLKNINSSNSLIRQFEERVAINMPIQGTAADMIKIAMINIFREFNKRNLKSKMLLQVHDELLFDVELSELNEVKEIVKKLMENALALNVPVLVEMGTGNNWLDAH